MNKTAIKNFAIWARVNLIESAKQRAYEYEITDGGQNNPNAEIIAGRPLSRDEQNQRKQLIEHIRVKGFDQVMEEAAYTWFNRFIALRYMEVNGYLPTRIRVFTNEEGEFKPEILKEAMTVELDGLNREKVFKLLDKQDNESLYKMLLIAQCNSLSAGLPYMFEKIANWTELLFPANLLKTDSVIGQMVSSIPEEDWMDAVQIIGWMYQYYNSELKDETFALLKKNVKITKERIPAATQLFTPDWIVRYMVENSLGRIYIQRKLVNSGDWLVADEETKVAMEKQEAEAMGWKYYLPEAEQEPAVREQLIVISNSYTGMKVEDIKVIDPCMGSGHILVYAFDVLMQIYTASGWSERDAAKSILENNLYGLDIDDRAGQLAYFAVMMKARKYNRRILNGEIRPNVMAIQDSSFMTEELISYVSAGNRDTRTALTEIRKTFTDAKEYGSILDVKPLDFNSIYNRIAEIEDSTAEDLFAMTHRGIAVTKLYELVKQAEIMAQKYHAVVTNPPYMGGSGMSTKLSDFVKKNYPDSKSDLYAVCIEKGNSMVAPNGFNCMVTMQSWMFLSSFEKMRSNILNSRNITNLMHMENMVMGIAFGTAVTIFQNANTKGFKGTYNHITMKDIVDDVPVKFPVMQNRFAQVSTDNFSKIPGSPVAYWVSDAFLDSFVEGTPLKNKGDTRQGMATSDNNRFLRLWHEINVNKLGLDYANADDARGSDKKWFPYNKGGEYRKWYGNVDYTINYENDGKEVKDYAISLYKTPSRTIKSMSEYFKPCLSWSKVSSGSVAFRYYPQGFIFDVAGCCIFYKDTTDLFYDFGLLNSKVSKTILSAISPTINYEAGHIASIPVIRNPQFVDRIVTLTVQNKNYAKCDWDAFETSWDFRSHPLVRLVPNIIDAYAQWESECGDRFNRLKANEEELNHIFIDIYGLQDELTPEVEDKDVTVRKADLQRDIKSFISYAIGCILGRYSLDVDGLVYAGGEWDENKYHSFIPDADNIIPICDDEYFADDIVGRFIKFVETVYGADTLEENLKFIADILGGVGTPRDVIRKYFLSDFYADHLKTYQKRPIYWLFDSGKKNGFKCLIYMHRYQPDTIARIRTDYIHELQSRYRTAISDLEDRVEHAVASERVKLSKQLAKIKDQELELRKYEEKIHHLADQMIEIDLDDGVKVNYAKFGDVLAKIK